MLSHSLQKGGQWIPRNQPLFPFQPEAEHTREIIWGLPMEIVIHPLKLTLNQIQLCRKIFLCACSTRAHESHSARQVEQKLFEEGHTTYRRILRAACALWKPISRGLPTHHSCLFKIPALPILSHLKFWSRWKKYNKLLGQHRVWQHARKTWQYLSACGCHFGKLCLPFLRNPGKQPGLT